MNWTIIKRYSARQARERSRLRASITPEERVRLERPRWTARDAAKWELQVEQPYEGLTVKRVTLEVGATKVVLSDMLPIPPYEQCHNPLYDPFTFEHGIDGRYLTPAAFDVLEKRVLEICRLGSM